MTKDNATPRPWHTRSGDCCIRIVEKSLPEGFSVTICELSIGSFNFEANAKLIVKAVNCHDELVEALKEAHAMLENVGIEKGQYYGKAINKVDQALSKAESDL